MVPSDYSPEYIFKHVGWRPHYIIDSIIRVPEPTGLNDTRQITKPSSAGVLDILPIELLTVVTNELDLQTLLRIRLLSHRGKAIVDSSPAYRDLRKYASKTIAALTRVGLLGYHSASTLHAALRSENCASCQRFAPFLFLPTCKRVCFVCLYYDRFWRVITPRMASTCFGIATKDLKYIPCLSRIAGHYPLVNTRKTTLKKPVALISMKQAKKLGISKYGSKKSMSTFVSTRDASEAQSKTTHIKASYLRASHTGVILQDIGYTPPDNYWGAASHPLPILRPDNTINNGL